jgi:hypothetical protein
MRDGEVQAGSLRPVLGLLAASALAYPILLCAVQIALAQLLRVDTTAVVAWLVAATLLSVAVVAVVRWGASRPVFSPWLLLGLLPPALYELWLAWPAVIG